MDPSAGEEIQEKYALTQGSYCQVTTQASNQAHLTYRTLQIYVAYFSGARRVLRATIIWAYLLGTH
ncbi:hypothetical protein ACLOJK_030131 [Asimina triloba]